MGKDTRIEWTHHTFNPWWGCVRVSDACDHCYAETWAKRFGEDVWGAKSERRFFGDAHWKEPLKWDREAKESHNKVSMAGPIPGHAVPTARPNPMAIRYAQT